MLSGKSPGYLDAFNEAFTRYSSQKDRPGYQYTLFTGIRHSGEKYPALVRFQNELTKSCDKNVLQQWLKNPELKAGHHSFRTYLIDVLIEFFPLENWEQFDNKNIVFYQPSNDYLYRGSLQKPEQAFAKGMKSGFNSKNIEDYTEVANENAGVSTSRSLRVASGYANKIWTNHYGVHEDFGYVYQIHYRGIDGIDIDKTHTSRNPSFPTSKTKQEINIVSCISPEDIVGCGYRDAETGEYIQSLSNPNYRPDKPVKNTLNKQKTLFKIFNGDKDDLIDELNEYIQTRQSEIGTFFGYFKDLSELNGALKVEAAKNLICALENKSIDFTNLQLAALVENNSTLGNIVNKYIKNGLQLPQKIVAARNKILADKSEEIFKYVRARL